MARAMDPDSAGSQFFIVTSDSTFLDGQYTAFGEVTEGMEIADKIVNLQRDSNDCPLEEAKMLNCGGEAKEDRAVFKDSIIKRQKMIAYEPIILSQPRAVALNEGVGGLSAEGKAQSRHGWSVDIGGGTSCAARVMGVTPVQEEAYNTLERGGDYLNESFEKEIKKIVVDVDGKRVDHKKGKIPMLFILF